MEAAPEAAERNGDYTLVPLKNDKARTITVVPFVMLSLQNGDPFKTVRDNLGHATAARMQHGEKH